MNILRGITYVLVLIGALNWGLTGMFGFDLAASLFGDMSVMTRIIYSVIGISAVVLMIADRGAIFDRECSCLN